MTSSADLARVLRAADDHRHDPVALHRALHLSLLAVDDLVGPDDVSEVVRAVERALASCACSSEKIEATTGRTANGRARTGTAAAPTPARVG